MYPIILVSKELLATTKKAFGGKWCESTARDIRRSWKGQSARLHGILEENASALLCSATALAIEPDGSPSKSRVIQEESAKQAQYFRSIDLKTHLMICHEILDFLAARTGEYAFEKIFVATLIQSVYIMREQGGVPPELALHQVKTQERSLFTSSMIGFVMGTHWTEHIQNRLSSQP